MSEYYGWANIEVDPDRDCYGGPYLFPLVALPDSTGEAGITALETEAVNRWQIKQQRIENANSDSYIDD